MLTRRALNRALLDRQLLLERSTMGTLNAVEHLVGLPAQAPNPPYLGLWSRLRDFAVADLSDLVTSRQVVRTALMRSALHLVTSRDCLGIRPLVQGGQEREVLAVWGEKLAGADPKEVARAGLQLVNQTPRTFAELGAALGERWPAATPAALIAAVRVGVPLVQVPPSGMWGTQGQPSYTSAEHWLGRPQRPFSLEDLIACYLAAFGPATVEDIEEWSGLPGLHEVTSRLGNRLVRLRDEYGVELFDLPDAPMPDPDMPAPVRYIAEFDAVVQSHADRIRIMSDADRRAVFAVNGVVPGTVLVDGYVTGTWKITRQRGAATLVVRPFTQIPTRDTHDLTEEGMRLLAFAAADASGHDVRFNSRG
jgi:hypothetical protein